MKNILTILILLLCSISLTSCYTKSIHKDELTKNHDLLIIPYKPYPIYIDALDNSGARAGSFIFGPLFIIGATATAKSDREIYANALEKLRGEWNHTTAMVKECSALIKNNGKVKINNIAIANIREIPGTEGEEPKVFTSSLSGRINESRFSPRSKWFLNDSPIIQYKYEYPKNTADWALELLLYDVRMRGDEIFITFWVKVINIETGENIAAFNRNDSFNISLIKDESGFNTFEKEFGVAVRKICGRALNEIGLINFNEQ